ALSLPTEAAARIALRTQQVVAFESGAAETVDPLAGSYYLEALTSEVEHKAWEMINKIDAMGGSVSAIEQGFMQDEIAKSAYDYQRKIETGEKVIVGVNKFTAKEENNVPGFRIDDSIRDEQIKKLVALKAKRDAKEVATALEAVRWNAVDGTNIMPSVVHAVEQYCTLGEIADVLRGVFGEYK
ncbi:MAG TPA: methylmalonyl-CoA mutase family protein, partial [Flavisolibacter sp.]